MNKLVYIVEDDTNIRELEMYALKNSSFDVMGFECGQELYTQMKESIPDLIILDIMLPDENGLDILKTIRCTLEYSKIPIILVTAKTSEIDIVKGLDFGADDYITKPFGVMELLSRAKAVLRRIEPIGYDGLIYRNICIYEDKHVVEIDGKAIDLTYKEYQILKYLIKNKGIVLTRDALMEKIWGYDFEQGNRTVDVHIQSLRKKLGNTGDHIKTIRNVGYKVGD